MLWRVSPSRSRRSPPGFIRPSQPILSVKPPTGDDWLHEVKFDGFRIVAFKDGERVRLWTRHGSDFTDRSPRIAAAVRGLRVDHALIDGEAVVLRADGHSDFGALRTAIGGRLATLVAFDLLAVDGEDRRQQPLEERRAALSKLTAGADGLQFSEALAAEGAVVFKHACGMGLEGIVSKRLGGRYWSGRSRNWVKTKNPEFQRR